MNAKKKLQKHNFIYRIHNFFANNRIKEKPFVSIGKFVSLKNSRIECRKNNKIVVGDHAVIHNSKIHVVGKNNKVILHNRAIINCSDITINGENCFIEIGENTSLNKSKLYSGDADNYIKIGDNCLIGFDCLFMTWDAHSIVDENGRKLNKPGNIIVQDHVWFASNCSVFKNTTIGENVVVGANSFLKNKNLEPKSVYIKDGVKIRTNINWKI